MEFRWTYKEMRETLNAMYQEAGWGKIAHAALGIEPFDTEAQARDVARWAHHHLATPTAYSMERAAKVWWDKSNAGIFGTVSWEALPEHVRQEKTAYMLEFWHEAAAMLVEDGTTPAKGEWGPAPSPDQIRREALKDAQRVAVRIMREEKAHGGDVARERAGAAQEIAEEIEALIMGGDDASEKAPDR